MHSNPPPEQSTAQIEQPHPQDDDEDDDEVIIEPLQYTYTSVNRPNNPIDTSAATATATATGPHTGTTLRDGIIKSPTKASHCFLLRSHSRRSVPFAHFNHLQMVRSCECHGNLL